MVVIFHPGLVRSVSKEEVEVVEAEEVIEEETEVSGTRTEERTGETIDREEVIGVTREAEEDGTAGADGEEIIEEIGTLLFLPTIGMMMDYIHSSFITTKIYHI